MASVTSERSKGDDARTCGAGRAGDPRHRAAGPRCRRWPLRPHRQPDRRAVRGPAPRPADRSGVPATPSARYLLSYSFIWGDELIIADPPLARRCPACSSSVRRRNVIRIEFFVDKFSPGPRKAIRLAGELVSAAMFAYLAWVSLEYVRLFGGDQTIYLRMADRTVQRRLGDRAAGRRFRLSRSSSGRKRGAGRKPAVAAGTWRHDRRPDLDRAAARASGPRRADAGLAVSRR